jgi:hypothetical protein
MIFEAIQPSELKIVFSHSVERSDILFLFVQDFIISSQSLFLDKVQTLFEYSCSCRQGIRCEGCMSCFSMLSMIGNHYESERSKFYCAFVNIPFGFEGYSVNVDRINQHPFRTSR